MIIKTVKCSVVTPSKYDWMGAKHNCSSLANCGKQLCFASSETKKMVLYSYTYVVASMIFGLPLQIPTFL